MINVIRDPALHREQRTVRYQNTQLYCECQLVALWNAGRFHGIEVPTMGTQQYRECCRKARGLYGGILDIEPECQRLGLRFVPGIPWFRWVRGHLPVHFAIFCHRGYHSVLVVETLGHKVKLANYTRGRTHWMTWETLVEKMNKRTKPYSIQPR